MDVLVIGAGVTGLSTAIRVQETGRSVTIWTSALPRTTTSSVAAAIWYPYRAYPEELVLAWSANAYTAFAALVDDPMTGVRMREGIELWRDPVPDPWWCSAVPRFGRAPAADLPVGYRDGYLFSVPVIDMGVYLHYLLDRFVRAGGELELRALATLDAAFAACSVVIDCAGLAARSLVNDPQLYPIRGQIVRVRNPSLERFLIDDHHPDGIVYVVPRDNDCILGGTANEGRWDLEPDPATATAIIQRCIALEPRLADVEVLEHKVGLRPGRPAIRLERENRVDGGVCIHNYGHGGAGVTLSWGCADEVVQLFV